MKRPFIADFLTGLTLPLAIAILTPPAHSQTLHPFTPSDLPPNLPISSSPPSPPSPSPPSPTPTYLLPAQGTITSGYGMRWGRMHQGIDIGVPVGTPVLAAADGVVEFSGWNSGGYGYMLDIRHADGSMTRYAHNSRLLVQAGDRIIQGQTIAESGSTGHSTGPHIHFEIHLATGETIDPMQVLVAVAPEENLVVRSNDPKTSSKELHLVQK